MAGGKMKMFECFEVFVSTEELAGILGVSSQMISSKRDMMEEYLVSKGIDSRDKLIECLKVWKSAQDEREEQAVRDILNTLNGAHDDGSDPEAADTAADTDVDNAVDNDADDDEHTGALIQPSLKHMNTVIRALEQEFEIYEYPSEIVAMIVELRGALQDYRRERFIGYVNWDRVAEAIGDGGAI